MIVRVHFGEKGKLKPLKLLIKNENLISAISKIGENFTISSECIKKLEEFITAIYNCKSRNLNEARAEMFKTEGLTDDYLPPTKDAFSQHVKRANYYAAVLKRANQQFFKAPSPTRHGWSDDFERVWCTESPAPELLLNNINCKCQKKCNNNRCSCKKMICYVLRAANAVPTAAKIKKV